MAESRENHNPRKLSSKNMTRERIQEILELHVRKPEGEHSQSVGAAKQARLQIGVNITYTNQ